MTRRLFLALACIILAGAHASAQSGTTLVILVRHAEKAAEPAADPSLTPAGTTRARALATALANVRVEAVITTELARTRETARPLAQGRGLTPEVVHTGARDAHANAVALAVRAHAGQTVLVVGHSNTIPAIIAALGGPKLPDICDTQYSSLFVLVVGEGRADLVISSYGAASSDPLMTCPSSLR
ncbi:MAG: SixA phosphatase family protein [Gemmatimonadales bacterium]